MVAQQRAKINYPLILRIVGWFLMIESAFMSIPLITAYIYHDASLKAFAISLLITLGLGTLMTFGIRPDKKTMGKREAIMVTSSVWVAFSLFGMLPFMLGEPHLDFSQAFFESVSGITTTGASVLRDIDGAPHGILIWRSLLQWIGGLGIIIFSLAILPMLNYEGGLNLFNAEQSVITQDKLSPRINQTAKSLSMVYISLTVIGFLLLSLGDISIFDSICHTFSAVSTGGYSTHGASVMAFDSVYIKCVILVFMFLGGTNFALIFKVAHGDFHSFRDNDIFRWYVTIVLVAAGIISISLFASNYADTAIDKIIDPLFIVVSTITTTGFASANYELWGSGALTIVIVLFFFGACKGSTTGAFKLDRIVYLMKIVGNEFYHILHPNNVRSIRVNDVPMPNDVLGKVVSFLVVYILLIATGAIFLSFTGIDPFNSFIASLSAVGNVGLGVGLTGFEGSWANIPDAGLNMLSLLMIAGRLELFSLLIIFSRIFWNK
ncbi:MAG: TrkH family potassium uptake protein [Muribaculaceae bacterium]